MEDADRKIRTNDIVVTLDDGKIVCNPSTLEDVRRGENIRWTCEHPFAVHLGCKSPLRYVSYSSDPLNNEYVIHKPVFPDFDDAPNDCYKYAIAVWDGDSGNVLIADPDIIIRPGPGRSP